MTKDRQPPLHPPGGDKSLKRRTLELGSTLLQRSTPLHGFDIYVVGFHCAKHDPQMQMEAHHFCKQVNADFLQCAIFDGNTEDANLIGIEYIISEQLFLSLPAEEQALWHPHNYEIFSGELVAPGLPDVAERELMSLLVNSYGKTWHLWHTGRHDGQPGHPLPMGEPMLMWSFNRDGEVDTSLRQNRIAAMNLDVHKKREERQSLLHLARPQRGVHLLRDAFPDADPGPPPGVRDVDDTPTSPDSVA
jgi:hypothetical protein